MNGLDDKLRKELIDDLSIDDISDQYVPIVELIGIENFIKISEYIHGERYYFPKPESILIPARNRKIRIEYDGYNKAELAVRFDLTQTHISNIVRETIPGQMSFEDWGYPIKKDA